MQLSEAGESRVQGYLFVLERSLNTFLPREVVRDAVREIESHLRERVLTATASPNEREAVERILGELGPPLRVAQAYSAERTIDEAVATGRLVPIVRAVGHLASTTIVGFFAALAVLVGYLTAFAFVAIAVLKPIFPTTSASVTPPAFRSGSARSSRSHRESTWVAATRSSRSRWPAGWEFSSARTAAPAASCHGGATGAFHSKMGVAF